MNNELHTAEKALEYLGIKHKSLQHIFSGQNSVFCDQDKTIVIRICKKDYDKESLVNEYNFINFLNSQGFSSCRLHSSMGVEPLNIDGRYFTVFHYIHNDMNRVNVDWVAVGAILKEFHNVARNYKGKLINSNFKASLNKGVDDLNSLKKNNILDDCYIDYLINQYILIENCLPEDFYDENHVSHGDFHVGNILFGNKLHLIDFESTKREHAYFDLIAVYVYFKRMNGNMIAFKEFSTGYGFDIRNWDLFMMAVNKRELSMITWVISQIPISHIAKDEAILRINDIRNGTNRKWSTRLFLAQ